MKNEIIRSWEKNAVEWARVIETGQIASREFTNEAIVKTLKSIPATKILDMGCGEGWLVREITTMGKNAVGIDVIETLLDRARGKGPETYYQMSYEEIIEGKPIPEVPFDVVVFNFCIYQKERLNSLLIQAKNAVSKNGCIIIQTLHPFFLTQNGLDYRSQWISDSWKGLPGNFTDGHSWYARIFEDWITILNESGLSIRGLKEVHDDHQHPISIIFEASV